MRRFVYLLCAFGFALTLTVGVLVAQSEQSNATEAPRVRTIELPFQGRMRQYTIYVPAMPNGSLVLVFHGGGQRPAQIQRITGFDALADREHFIVAYPEAFERSWADGRNVTSAEQQGVDDVGLAKAVAADIGKAHAVDRSRIFATGLSNGAALSHRLACEAADTFAAIAPVAGTIATGVVKSCQPSRPVAVVSIHGLADPSVPFNGGYVGGQPRGGQVESSRATQELWRTLNGCGPAVTSTQLPVVVKDGTSVTRRAYPSCREHGDVVAYEIEAGGHRWPPHLFDDRNEAMARQENGISSQNINAREVIWAFFTAHGRR